MRTSTLTQWCRRLLPGSFGAVVLALCAAPTLAQPTIQIPPGTPLTPAHPPTAPSGPPVPSTQNLVVGSLQVVSTNPAITLWDTASGKEAALRNTGGDVFLGTIVRSSVGNVDTSAYRDLFSFKTSGNVGIGARDPAHRLSIQGGPQWTGNYWKGALELENGAALAWQANTTAGQRFGIGHSDGGFYFFRTKSDPAKTDQPAVYDMTIKDDGTVSVKTLEITGADLAEDFDVAPFGVDGVLRPEPGMVVSIDSERPGRLVVSDRAYDHRVAGVISGEGGLGPGVRMGRMSAPGEGHPSRCPAASTHGRTRRPVRSGRATCSPPRRAPDTP